MEVLLFQFLGFGFLCLSASLLTGFFYLEDIFAQHLVHKTVLSIVGWVILASIVVRPFSLWLARQDGDSLDPVGICLPHAGIFRQQAGAGIHSLNMPAKT